MCVGGGLSLTKYRTTSGPFLWSWDQSDSGDDECYKYHHYSHSISVISSYSYMLCSYEVRERIRLYFRADPSRTDFFCNQILLQPDSRTIWLPTWLRKKKWQQSHATKSSKPAIGRHVETTGRDKHSINRRTNSKSCNNHSPSETLKLIRFGNYFVESTIESFIFSLSNVTKSQGLCFTGIFFIYYLLVSLSVLYFSLHGGRGIRCSCQPGKVLV